MRRRNKILATLTLVVCVVVAWFSIKWLTRPEMRPDFAVNLGDGVTLEMIWIPGGTFDMGSQLMPRDVASKYGGEASRYAPERPPHIVTLDGFWMGKYEVTQAQYGAVMERNPSKIIGANNPVDRVSWNDATEFCRKLSAKTSQTFTLPTEAQWEYACRAGSRREYCFGDSKSQLRDYAWFKDNSTIPKLDDLGSDFDNYLASYLPGDFATAVNRKSLRSNLFAVGGKKPNAWGLYDMHGNVSEWCQDYWNKNYWGAPNDGSAFDFWDNAWYTLWVIRGGGLLSTAGDCRSSFRRSNSFLPSPVFDSFPPAPLDHIGFRIVRTANWSFASTGLKVENNEVEVRAQDNDGAYTPTPYPSRIITRQEIQVPGSVAYYFPFTGNTNDASGSNHHMTLNGGAVFATDRCGAVQSALELDGVDDYVDIPHHSDFDLTDAVTIAAWIKRDNSNEQGMIVSKSGYSPTGTCNYYFCVADNNLLEFRFWTTTWRTGLSRSAITDNAWHHVAVTYDRQNIRFYLDGIEDAARPQTEAMTPTGNEHFQIGWGDIFGASSYFAGSIDEVRLYNRALSATEIASQLAP